MKKNVFWKTFISLPEHFQAYVQFAVFLQLKKLKFYILHFLEEKKIFFHLQLRNEDVMQCVKRMFF